MTIHQDLTQTHDDLLAQIAALREQNDRLRQDKAKAQSVSLRLKVSEKRALSVYGMGKFPITLYKEQWLRLLAIADAIRQFIADHEDELKAKGD